MIGRVNVMILEKTDTSEIGGRGGHTNIETKQSLKDFFEQLIRDKIHVQCDCNKKAKDADMEVELTIKELQTQNARLKQQLIDFEKNKGRNMVTMENDKQMADLKEENKRLTFNITNIQKKTDDLQKINSKLTTQDDIMNGIYVQQLADLYDEIFKLQTENKKLKDERADSCEKLKKLDEQMKVLLTQNKSLIEENSDVSQNISDYNSKEAGLQKEIMRKEGDLKSLCNREHEWRNEIIALKAQMSGQQKRKEKINLR